MDSNIDLYKVMQDQPTFNIGMIGSVSDGKSTIVKRLTTINTQRHSSERKGNKTINLGYANAKIYQCPECPKPICYQSYPSEIYSANCEHCSANMNLVRHVSFVDVPGHNSLMATMLNGSCIMDNTIVVEAVNNKTIPAPQTKEHLIVAKFMNLPNEIVCMNKLDLVKKSKAAKKIEEFQEYLEENNTVCKGSFMVPIAANYGFNKDVLCDLITRLEEPMRDLYVETKMLVVRSFKNNRPDTKIKDIKGGVVGGTIIQGVLRVGDKVEILPGLIQMNGKKDGPKWSYRPLTSKVLSIQSEKNKLDLSIPGGLVGVQLTLDPGLASKDGLVGNVLRVINDKYQPDEYKIFEVLRVHLEKIREGEQYEIQKNDRIVVSYNSKNVNCLVKIKRGDKAELVLDSPVCAQIGDHITLSKKDGKSIKIMCRGKIGEGDCADLISL